MASIERRKRTDGTIGYRVVWFLDHRLPSGKFAKDYLTFDDETEAEKFKAILEAAGNNVQDAVAAYNAVENRELTVAQMLDEHIKLLTGIEERTRRDYNNMAAYHLVPLIGSLSATAIERDRIRAWVNKVSCPDPTRAGGMLTQARKDAELSREQLAERLGWPVKKVTGYETGKAPLVPDDLAEVFVALRVLRVRRQLINTVAFGMGAKTLRNVHALLSAAVTWAIDNKKVARSDNPAKNIRLPKYTPAEMTFLTPAEFGLFVSYFGEPYQLMVRVLAGTGMRWGELIALQVGDVALDVEHPYVNIDKAVKRAESGHYIGSPKSARSVRLVSLPRSLVEPLRVLIGDRDEDDWLFRGPRGGRVHYSNFYSHQWVPAVKAVTATRTPDGEKVPRERRITKKRIRIHDLRHTHASWLIARKVDLATVQRRLGHESITTTVDRYGHLDPSQLQAAARAADAALATAGAPVDPLPDVLATVVDLDTVRLARANADVDPFSEHDEPGASVPAPRPAAVPVLAELPEELARVVLGDELRRVRKQAGITQADLITRLPFDLHVATLRGYEGGRVALTVTRFMQLCLAMGSPVAPVMERVMQRLAADTLPPTSALDEEREYTVDFDAVADAG